MSNRQLCRNIHWNINYRISQDICTRGGFLSFVMVRYRLILPISVYACFIGIKTVIALVPVKLRRLWVNPWVVNFDTTEASQRKSLAVYFLGHTACRNKTILQTKPGLFYFVNKVHLTSLVVNKIRISDPLNHVTTPSNGGKSIHRICRGFILHFKTALFEQLRGGLFLDTKMYYYNRLHINVDTPTPIYVCHCRLKHVGKTIWDWL